VSVYLEPDPDPRANPCPECPNGRTYVAEVDEGGRPVLHCDHCEWFS
jgi:hypothetical protein